MKSLGDKTSSLFERKKKDVEKLAHDKAAEAQKMAEEQAQKASESLMKTKGEAENIAASTGMINLFKLMILNIMYYVHELDDHLWSGKTPGWNLLTW